MATSRKEAREALAALLEAARAAENLAVKTVADSKQTALEGITPLITVLGRGSRRAPLTTRGNQAIFEFIVQVWVLRKGDNWTLAEAEDALDEIEAGIATVYEDNSGTGNWVILEYADPTMIAEAKVAGVPYYVETIPTRVFLKGN